MRRIISILLQNEAGSLLRVAGLFSARGYNIESLTVAPTDDEQVSRLTLVTVGDEDVISQIIRQLDKLIDVVHVMDLSTGAHFEREIVFVKLELAEGTSAAVLSAAKQSNANMLEQENGIMTLQLTAIGPEINEFVQSIGQLAKVIEVVRSGVAAVASADRILSPA